MELAISSIAWTNEEEEAVAERLQALNVKHVEVAPTKLWEDPTRTPIELATKYVEWWSKYNIQVSAFQSMLFARPDLKIFDSEQNYKETLEYMTRFIELAGVMCAGKMVFGSPKNRQRGELSIDNANDIAYDFFGKLGDVAIKNNVVLCLEPNAPQYNCDYITTASEGLNLVKSVNNYGFGLHLDTACMALAGDDAYQSIVDSSDVLEHFHVSAPMLGQVDSNTNINHEASSRALKEIGYNKLISIEMRPGDIGDNVERVEKAVQFTRSMYF